MLEKTLYLTQEWLEKLQKELEYLKTEKRLEIAEKLKEAISFWDLSENSEYEDARNEQAQVELRILEIDEQLKHVELVKEDKGSKKVNKINIGSKWTILKVWDGNDKKEDFVLVGSTESDILSNPQKIGNESPIWTAIIWKKKGDTVKVKTPAGKLEYKILSIN